jgi:type I restriction enzyme R subunit
VTTVAAAEIVAPLEERVAACWMPSRHREAHLRGSGFEPDRELDRREGVRPHSASWRMRSRRSIPRDEAKRRFEILAREVFSRFKALLVEPSALTYAERHDNIEAIYKKLTERRDTADVSELLKELHRIVNRRSRRRRRARTRRRG